MPEPGEEFTVRLGSECHVELWNWGSLEVEPKDKNFVNLPHPRILGRKEEVNELGQEWVAGYGWILIERMRTEAAIRTT